MLATNHQAHLETQDDGWDASKGQFLSASMNSVDYDGHERHVTYTASTTQPAGVVLTSGQFSSTLDFMSGGVLPQVLPEQILVYMGSKSSPVFLCALDLNEGAYSPACTPTSPADWTIPTCAYQSDYMQWTNLPTGE